MLRMGKWSVLSEEQISAEVYCIVYSETNSILPSFAASFMSQSKHALIKQTWLKKKKIYVAAGWWSLCACVWLCGFVPMSWHTKGPLFIHLNSDRGPKKHVGYSGPQRSTSVTISLQSVTRKTCCCFSMKSSTVCFALFTFKCSVNQL